MSAVWSVAEMFDVVPQPPNSTLAKSLSMWWEHPRQFGCGAAKSTAWVVVAPDLRVWCPLCAMRRLQDERRCMYCYEEVDVDLDLTLVYEMKTIVTVLGRAHHECEKEAEEE